MTSKIRVRIRTNGWAPKRAKTEREAAEALERALMKFLKRHDVRVSKVRPPKFRARRRFVAAKRPYFSVSSDVRAVVLMRHGRGKSLGDLRRHAKRCLELKAYQRRSLGLYTWSATGFKVSVR